MGFQYETGTATDLPDWFAKLEAFLSSTGWTVISGSGTTTIVFNSGGEAGGRQKLFIRFRRSVEKVYYRVQDDADGAPGMHATDDTSSYNQYLTAPGGGAAAFSYWMCSTKDMVAVTFLSGASYTGCYVGLAEPFAISIPDEEYQMVAFCIHRLNQTYSGRVLRNYAGNWDQGTQHFNVIQSYNKCPLDDSYPIFGVYVKYGTGGYNIIGEPQNISGRIQTAAGLNTLDTITTDQTTWIILGSGTIRWAMRTGGAVTLGREEGKFEHESGLATTVVDFNTKLKAFLTGLGWTEFANPSPAYAIDYFMYSDGESGLDSIWARLYYNPGNSFGMRMSDDINETHARGVAIGSLVEADFPTRYWITADLDCIVIVLENEGILARMWAGVLVLMNPDPDAIGTPYKQAVWSGELSGGTRTILRDHSGNYYYTISLNTDMYTASPNSLDGYSHVVWPILMRTGTCVLGAPKYLHALSGARLSMGDTVAIGNAVYTYLSGNVALRTA